MFAVLPQHQQRQVHRYYAPSHDLSEAELLIHRKAISKHLPSLPARASKAFARLEQVYRQAEELAKGDERVLKNYIWEHALRITSQDERGHLTEVAAIARPEIDVDTYVSALIEYAAQRDGRP